MALAAKYSGNCPDCGQSYAIGTMIAKLPSGWGHDVCPPVKTPDNAKVETPAAEKAANAAVQAAVASVGSPWATFVPSSFQSDFLNALLEKKCHIVLEAVAGSGKTTTICWALWTLLSNASEKIKALFLAFNKSIATELGSRVPKGCEASTLNSCGARLLGRRGFKLSPDNGQAYTLYRSIWPIPQRNKLGHPLKKEEQRNKALESACITLYNRCRQSLVEPSLSNLSDLAFRYSVEGWQEDSQEIAERVTTLLQKHSDAAKSHFESGSAAAFDGDFDDQVWLPYVLNLTDNSYDVVVVDEAQDLSASQVDLVLRLLTPWGRVVAVGDPRQAIYGFRGAGITSMEDLANTLRASKLGCETLPLSVCYRCPTDVIKFLKLTGFGPANISASETAPQGVVAVKRESDLMAEVKAILAAEGGKPEHIMLLSSLNAPLVPAVLSLVRAGIPARIQGRDASKGVRALIDEARKKADSDTIAALLISATEITDRRAQKATERQEPTEEYYDLLDTLKALCGGGVEGDPLVESFDALYQRIDTIFSNADGDAKGVLASTVHRAKGLEREHVFILRPDALPVFWCKAEWEHKQAENCAYVALTRAKHRLVMLTGEKGLSAALKSAWQKFNGGPDGTPDEQNEDAERYEYEALKEEGCSDPSGPDCHDDSCELHYGDNSESLMGAIERDVEENYDSDMREHDGALFPSGVSEPAKVDLASLPTWHSEGDGVFTPPTLEDWKAIEAAYRKVGCDTEILVPVGWRQYALDIWANGCHIRVSTTVDERDDGARKKGANAIDVVRISPNKKGAQRVFRVAGWQGRMAERVRGLLA